MVVVVVSRSLLERITLRYCRIITSSTAASVTITGKWFGLNNNILTSGGRTAYRYTINNWPHVTVYFPTTEPALHHHAYPDRSASPPTAIHRYRSSTFHLNKIIFQSTFDCQVAGGLRVQRVLLKMLRELPLPTSRSVYKADLPEIAGDMPVQLFGTGATGDLTNVNFSSAKLGSSPVIESPPWKINYKEKWQVIFHVAGLRFKHFRKLLYRTLGKYCLAHFISIFRHIETLFRVYYLIISSKTNLTYNT